MTRKTYTIARKVAGKWEFYLDCDTIKQAVLLLESCEVLYPSVESHIEFEGYVLP